MDIETQILCANPKCFVAFKPKRSWQRYCSVPCRNIAYNKTILIRLKPIVECPHCKQEINLKEIKEQ
jgi:hypothetical protein